MRWELLSLLPLVRWMAYVRGYAPVYVRVCVCVCVGVRKSKGGGGVEFGGRGASLFARPHPPCTPIGSMAHIYFKILVYFCDMEEAKSTFTEDFTNLSKDLIEMGRPAITADVAPDFDTLKDLRAKAKRMVSAITRFDLKVKGEMEVLVKAQIASGQAEASLIEDWNYEKNQ